MYVQYFGANESDAQHEQNVFGLVNDTMALARRLRRSDGSVIPIVANTKPTYHKGPLVAPYAGWVEPSTTKALFARWAQEPLVERVLYWFYSEASLAYYKQPNLTEQRAWWLSSKDAIAPGC